MFPNIRMDLRANSNIISRLIMITYRFGSWVYYHVKAPLVRQLLWIIYKFFDIFIVRILGSSEIQAKAKIGGGCCLVHGGNGVIIHPGAVIGENAVILHQVTVGTVYQERPPHIGNRVVLGAGAKILGSVTIGDGAKIGANAVVLKDVPKCSTAVGIPARIVIKKIQKSS